MRTWSLTIALLACGACGGDDKGGDTAGGHTSVPTSTSPTTSATPTTTPTSTTSPTTTSTTSPTTTSTTSPSTTTWPTTTTTPPTTTTTSTSAIVLDPARDATGTVQVFGLALPFMVHDVAGSWLSIASADDWTATILEVPSGLVRADEVGPPMIRSDIDFPVLGDIDGDGLADWVAYSSAHHLIWVMDPAAPPADLASVAANYGTEDPGLTATLVGEVDGDGVLDVIYGGDGWVCVVLGPILDDPYTSVPDLCVTGDFTTPVPQIRDVNGDLEPDLALIAVEPTHISTHVVLGPLGAEHDLAESAGSLTSPAGSAHSLADVDSDGDLDVVAVELVGLTVNSFALDGLLGVSTSADAEWNFQVDPGDTQGVIGLMGDFDGDGSYDLTSTHTPGGLRVHLGPFPAGTVSLSDPDYKFPAALFDLVFATSLDVDADGVDTLVVHQIPLLPFGGPDASFHFFDL
jgi:hypothetical protein